jgi:transcriptional regulator with XRE-family HTH domain
MAHPIFSKEYDVLRQMLVEERRKRGITQVALARKLKLTQGFVSKIECGERRMDIFELLKLARAIGFDAPSFLKRLVARTRFSGKP